MQNTLDTKMKGVGTLSKGHKASVSLKNTKSFNTQDYFKNISSSIPFENVRPNANIRVKQKYSFSTQNQDKVDNYNNQNNQPVTKNVFTPLPFGKPVVHFMESYLMFGQKTNQSHVFSYSGNNSPKKAIIKGNSTYNKAKMSVSTYSLPKGAMNIFQKEIIA